MLESVTPEDLKSCKWPPGLLEDVADHVNSVLKEVNRDRAKGTDTTRIRNALSGYAIPSSNEYGEKYFRMVFSMVTNFLLHHGLECVAYFGEEEDHGFGYDILVVRVRVTHHRRETNR